MICNYTKHKSVPSFYCLIRPLVGLYGYHRAYEYDPYLHEQIYKQLNHQLTRKLYKSLNDEEV